MRRKMGLKQIIVIRKNLKMSKGKMVSQGAHASLGAFINANEKIQKIWLKGGAKKVILKVEDEKEIGLLEKIAKKEKLPTFLVRDAGKTQLEVGTVTAIGIGPAEEGKVDKVTGKLKLL